jgi:molybdopterin converting factor small subunit
MAGARMKLKVFDPLPEKLGFKDREIKLLEPTSIRALKELSSIDLEDFFLAINRNRIASPDTTIEDTDELWILPLVDGG